MSRQRMPISSGAIQTIETNAYHALESEIAERDNLEGEIDGKMIALFNRLKQLEDANLSLQTAGEELEGAQKELEDRSQELEATYQQLEEAQLAQESSQPAFQDVLTRCSRTRLSFILDPPESQSN